MTLALLYSAGLDSTCAWWVLNKPAALYVGGPHGPNHDANMGEANALAAQMAICPEFANALQVREVDYRPFQRKDVWQCPRDEIGVISAWAAGFDEAAIAWVREDGASAAHLERMAARIACAVPAAFDFKLWFPVASFTKTQLVRAALAAGAPADFIRASFSCNLAATPCGGCENCRQRERALREAGL